MCDKLQRVDVLQFFRRLSFGLDVLSMVMDPLVVENSLQCLWAGTQQQLEAETTSTVGDGVP